tara:strand:+ start:29 stop:394 length:366 start_codon:yes stop_codon:yes gene_type:complete
METKIEINNRLEELSEETQLGVTRFINSMASHRFNSDEIVKELNELNEKLVDKWRLEQNIKSVNDWEFILTKCLDIMTDKQGRKLFKILDDCDLENEDKFVYTEYATMLLLATNSKYAEEE